VSRPALVAAALLALAGGVEAGRGGYVVAKARLAQLLLERSFRTAAASGELRPPWPWADAVPVGRLLLPGDAVGQVVLAGASGRNLAFAPGHLHGTARPGEVGACVVAGHRDTHFARLGQLRPGDEVAVDDLSGRRWRYQVSDTAVVDEHDGAAIAARGGAELILVTCWPFDALAGAGDQRYVVRCRLAGEACAGRRGSLSGLTS
jgi:sortase A